MVNKLSINIKDQIRANLLTNYKGMNDGNKSVENKNKISKINLESKAYNTSRRF